MKTKAFLFAITVFFLASCYLDIDIYNQNFKSLLVLNSLVQNDTNINLQIGISTIPGQLDTTKINLANVDEIKIYKIQNGQKILVEEKQNVSSPYISTVKTEPEQYQIEVTAENKTAIANFKIPQLPDIQEIKYDSLSIDTGYFLIVHFKLKITFQDPDTSNYYAVYAYNYQPKLLWDSVGNVRTDTSAMHIEYVFLTPVNFMDVHSFKLVYYSPAYFDGLIFTDEFFNGQTHTVKLSGSVSLPPDFNYLMQHPEIQVFINFCAIERSLYLFADYDEKYRRSEFNPFVEPVNPYSNVKDGLGLVAGMNCFQDTLKINLFELLGL